MADIKVYKNEDYTASMVMHDDGTVDYFIKYHSSTHPQEIEVSEREYLLYVGEFRKPAERDRNEKRRHIHSGELEEIDEEPQLLTRSTDFSEHLDVEISVDTVLKTCTQIQQKRFRLHRDYGYTLTEIAEMENCNKSVVRRSVNAVDEKIKKIFF